VWSSSFEDSKWCEKEYNTLESKENAGDGFRYVIALIDQSEPAGLAAGKLCIDFSDQPEGPAGTSLLKLLFGLQDLPLSPDAVKLAAQVDEQMRDGLVNIKSSRDIGATAGLVKLSETDNMAWTSSPMLLCATADALIALKEPAKALAILDRAEQMFPKAVRPKQLRGLALARSGQTQEAQQVISKLHAADEIGPETLGIYARTWMDLYNTEGETIYLLKSRDLYLESFEKFPTDYYTGINAASKSLLADEPEKATELAQRVLELTGEEPDRTIYWKTASIAEAQLLLGRYEDAAKMYRAAVVSAPKESGSHESTRKQAALLLDKLDATDEQKLLVLGAFPAPKAAAS
jgi:tetratricopeptide (TPR) repeat protein